MSLSEEEAQLLIDLGERLSAAMGGAAAEDEPADDMDDMDDMEDMGPVGPEGEEGDEPAPGGRDYMMEEEDQDDIVNEVLKRVTKRLVAEKLKSRK